MYIANKNYMIMVRKLVVKLYKYVLKDLNKTLYCSIWCITIKHHLSLCSCVLLQMHKYPWSYISAELLFIP